jgi:hypothetical protein
MKNAQLTSTSLLASLEQLASAASESECATALVAAATLMQEAVLAGQSTSSFHDALDACPESLRAQLSEVLDRTANFHMLADGGTLGLWLLPVVVTASEALPSAIALETASMNSLKMSGCLLEQLGLSAAVSGKRTGWNVVMPTLYSDAQIRNADLGELVRLPHAARDFVRGQRKVVNFNTGADLGPVEPGTSLYFLPFVTFTPDGMAPAMPLTSARTNTRMTQWATDTLQSMLAGDFAVHIGHVPQPFSLGLRVGERLRNEVYLRDMMQGVCAESGVEANGLAALVAPYATRQSDGTFMVGVSLVSRLTQNVVATLSLPVETESGADEVALATHILKDLGMECIQDYEAPISTTACQHCGSFQYALPSAELACHGMTKQDATVLH